MGHSGKGSAASSQSLDYYGTVAGAVCWGPLDWLVAVICNGNYIWQCPSTGALDLTAPGVVNASGYVDLTGGVLDQTLIGDGGYLRLYIGTGNQAVDPALPLHPNYFDTVYLLANKIFFGQDSGTAPNLQVIGGRLPRVPTTIVAAADNIKDGGRQINPIAFLAEFLLDERGKGLTAAQLDSASWLAAAHWCAQDATHIAYSFCSPLTTDQGAARDVVKRLLDPINGYLRWLPNGTLGCFIYEWGTDPGGLTTVDARHYTADSELDDGDWVDVPTKVVVSFPDSAYEFQQNTVTVPNERAAQIRQIASDQTDLARPDVTRQAQAFAQAQEYIRRVSLAPGTGTVKVRAPMVAGVVPGSKIKLNDNPEPAEAGVAQLARVDKVEFDFTDEVTLSVTLDPLLPGQAYSPNWLTPLLESTFAGQVQSAPSIQYAQAIPLPPAEWGWPPMAAFLATRPSAEVAGFVVYFAPAAGGTFTELGAQVGWAARGSLVNAIAAGDGTIEIQLLDGGSGPDDYLAANTPGGNATEADDDTLLAVVLQLDGGGRVAIDGTGLPIMEFCSIEQRSVVNASTANYTVLRGRCTLAARAWPAAAPVWIVPKVNLKGYTYRTFPALQGSAAYFRLASFLPGGVCDESNPLPEADLVFPPLAAPTGLTALAPGGPLVTLAWADAANLDDGFDEYIVQRSAVGAAGPWTEIGRTTSTGFHDTGQVGGMVIGQQYWYAVAAADKSGDQSANSNVATATPVGVAANQTPPQAAGSITEVDGRWYIGSDGTIHAAFDLLVPSLPAAGAGTLAAAWQNVLFRITGSSNQWQIGAGNLTNTSAVTVPVDRLAPGQSYDIALQAFTSFGMASAVVLASGIPYVAPSKSTAPGVPTAFGLRAPLASDSIPPVYSSLSYLPSGMIDAAIAYWTNPADADLSGVELLLGVGVSNPGSLFPYDTWGSHGTGQTFSGSPSQTMSQPIYLVNVATAAYHWWVRFRNTSGVISSWTDLGSPGSDWSSTYAGTLGKQNASNPQVTGLQVGGSGYASGAQSTNTDDWDSLIYTTVGGAPAEKFYVNISGRGFNAKPAVGGGILNSAPTQDVLFRYDYDDAGNSSTQAALYIYTRDGSNLSAGDPYRYMSWFKA